MPDDNMSFHALKDHDDYDKTHGIIADGQRSQGGVTIVASPMTAEDDHMAQRQTDDATLKALYPASMPFVKQAAAKGMFRTVGVVNTAPIQVLPYDPNRKIARVYAVSITNPILLGPATALNNYAGQTTAVGAARDALWVPPFTASGLSMVLEYTGASEVWGLCATSGAGAVSYLAIVNETYAEKPQIG